MMSHPSVAQQQRKHSHYFKSVKGIDMIDVYRVLELFGVTDQALGHAIKKLLVAGGRGHKDIDKDIQEAIDTLHRWQEMRAEDAAAVKTGTANLFGVDLAKGVDVITGIKILGGVDIGAAAGASAQSIRRNQILAAPWINLTGHTAKPAEVMDDQLVRVKYRSGGEDIKAARDVSWRGVTAYQVFNLG